jgi:hypothetical protein
MFYSPKLFLRDWWINIPLLIALGLQLFMWWYLLSHFHSSADQIFLHYNIIFGVDLVGDWWRIFYLPAGGLLALFVNYVFSWALYGTDRLLARFLSIWTAIATFFLVIAVWLISGLNI